MEDYYKYPQVVEPYKYTWRMEDDKYSQLMDCQHEYVMESYKCPLVVEVGKYS
jgi:hypothetical protein